MGRWELELNIASGGVEDKVVVVLDL
jgi:hypothetical protein